MEMASHGHQPFIHRAGPGEGVRRLFKGLEVVIFGRKNTRGEDPRERVRMERAEKERGLPGGMRQSRSQTRCGEGRTDRHTGMDRRQA